MNKKSMCIALLFLGGIVFSQENHFLSMRPILQKSNLTLDFDEVFSKLDQKWKQANSLHRAAREKFDRRQQELEEAEQKIRDMKQEISENEKRQDALKNIERGEFEERSAFAKRQAEANASIAELKSKNLDLNRKIKELEAGLPSQQPKVPLHMSFDFEDSYQGNITLNSTNYSLSRFDIDNKCFTCTIKGGILFSHEKKADGTYHLLEIRCPDTSFKLFFDSPEQARIFKNQYLWGTPISEPCTVVLSGRQEWKAHMDKPAEKTTDIENIASYLGKAASTFLCAAVAEGISPGSGQRVADGFNRSDPYSHSWSKEIPAVYNKYESFYLTFTIKFNDKCNGPGQMGQK